MPRQNAPTDQPPTRLDVFTIRDRTTEDGKDFWVKIGSAWKNRDGSLNIKLDALPLNGKLQVRKPRPREDNG